MPSFSVLVVDDDPVIVRLLQVNFEMEGWAVHTAADGEEGLQAARDLRPDAVVLDVMMPKLNGIEVLERLRADDDTRTLPVVLLSAKAQDSEIQKGLDVGADDYVTKPFDPLELIDRVLVVVARARRT